MKTYMIPVTELVALDPEMIMLDLESPSGSTEEVPPTPHPGAPGRLLI